MINRFYNNFEYALVNDCINPMYPFTVHIRLYADFHTRSSCTIVPGVIHQLYFSTDYTDNMIDIYFPVIPKEGLYIYTYSQLSLTQAHNYNVFSKVVELGEEMLSCRLSQADNSDGLLVLCYMLRDMLYNADITGIHHCICAIGANDFHDVARELTDWEDNLTDPKGVTINTVIEQANRCLYDTRIATYCVKQDCFNRPAMTRRLHTAAIQLNVKGIAELAKALKDVT